MPETPAVAPQPPQSPTPEPEVAAQPAIQAPTANYQQPTQAQQQAPYEQQPVQQQYFAQPNAASVQYVVQAQSLKGVQGWLGFFMIMAGLAALSYAGMLTAALSNLSGATEVVTAIFSPILFVAAIAAVATIAMEKRIASKVYIGFSTLILLYNIVTTATFGEVAAVVSGVLMGGVWLTFVILYFHTSKRVKETLVK